MTDVEIVSAALELLGDAPISAIPDATQPHSARLGRFLIRFRDEILLIHDWPWVRRQKELTELESLTWANSTAYVAGDYIFNATAARLYECITSGTSAAAPATCPATTSEDITDGTAHWRYVSDVLENDTEYEYRYPLPVDCLRAKSLNNGEDYIIEGRIIYTNAEAPTTDFDGPVLRYVKKIEDYDLWDPLMVDALITRIAAAAAPIITGKPRNDLLQEYGTWLQASISKQAMEGHADPQETTLWTEADE